jgi:hypothetical protein
MLAHDHSPDSQSAILAAGATCITTKTAMACREALNHLGILNEVNLAWIKAHAGHAGNELADKLAKNGTLRSTIRCCPVGDTQIKLNTKQAILKVWQNEWNEHDHCWQTKVFFNKINTNKMAPLMGKCDRKTIGKLVQFLTGIAGLMYSLETFLERIQ